MLQYEGDEAERHGIRLMMRTHIDELIAGVDILPLLRDVEPDAT